MVVLLLDDTLKLVVLLLEVPLKLVVLLLEVPTYDQIMFVCRLAVIRPA
jgi:hypothetical protein